jgi:anti-sigma regulatory factor (Ser/Thr protein kinase)
MNLEQPSGTRLSFQAHTDQLVVIRDHIRTVLAMAPWLEVADIDALVLAVDEACANLIEHGYSGDAAQMITIEVLCDASAVNVNVFDTAAAFDPRTLVPPNLGERVHQGLRGGLGVHIMSCAVDTINYHPASSPGNANMLTLTKLRR